MGFKRRGVGSNQYADKAPSIKDDEQFAAQVRRVGALPVPSSNAHDARKDQEAIGQLALQVGESIDKSLDGRVNQYSPDEAREQVIRPVAEAEDEILQRYPNFYGQCVVDAVWYGARLERDPVEQERIASGDPTAVGRHAAFTSLLKDVTGVERLDEDQITEALDTIADSEEHGPFGPDEKETQDSHAMHRFAALSVVSSRNSDGPDEAMQDEMEMIAGDLNKSFLKNRLRLD